MVDSARKERDKIIRKAVREAAKPYKPTPEIEPKPPKQVRREVWAVDFDGTLCENWWPNIGPPNLELIALLKSAHKAGIALILWTCREGELLYNAIDWCIQQGLTFDAANENLPEVIEAYGGTNPRKISASLYLDDRAVHLDRKDWRDLWTTVHETQSGNT